MDRARMNSAIRVFNTAVLAEGDGGYVSEKVRRSTKDFTARVQHRFPPNMKVCPFCQSSCSSFTLHNGCRLEEIIVAFQTTMKT